MKTWPSKTMGEITLLVTDGKHGDCEDDENSGYYFLSSKDLRNGRLQYDQPRQITREGFAETHRRTDLEPGDILLANCGASIGRVGIAQDDPRIYKTTFQKSVSVIKANRAVIDNRFLYYFVAFKSSLLIRLGNGAAQPNLLIGDLKRIEVPVPPLPVQGRIADILSAYDELIENNQQRIGLLEAMARALYREWFVLFRFPGHEKLRRVACPLGDIPQGWEVKSVGAVAHTFRGRSYRSVDLADEGGLPFLNLKCLDRDGGFRRSGLKRYTGEFKDSHIAKKGDIVMGVTDMTQERRIVARAALVPTLDKEFGISSMDLVRIEPKPPMPKVFLYSFLRYSSFADEVKQHANGANVLHLAPERITDFKFAAPPTELMCRFADVVAPTLGQMDTLENQIRNLRQTRDLLLPRLLSGVVEVDEHRTDGSIPATVKQTPK
jgi:type I restriction enzyme S subunit